MFTALVPIYLCTHYLYEKTLTPRDLLDILEDNISERLTIERRASNHPESLIRRLQRLCSMERAIYLGIGALYAYTHTRYYITETRELPFLSKHFMAEFLCQIVITQFIHFNKDASLIALFMGSPLVAKWTGADHDGGTGLIGKALTASSNFLHDTVGPWKIGFILAYMALAKETFKQESDNTSASSSTILSRRTKIGLFVGGTLAGATFFAYKNPTVVSEITTGIKKFLGR